MQNHNILYSEEGLYFTQGQFFLDPIKPVVTAIISHAHADHVTIGSRDVYCTPYTAALIRKRHRNYPGIIHQKNFSEPFEVNGITVTFIPAGHILGSAQVLLEKDNVRYLYTGDFKLSADDTCEGFQFAEADVLITETTFALPGTTHPDPKQEIEKLNNFNDTNLVIGCYSLGKAQRLTQLINTYCTDKTIMVHKYMLPYHYFYQEAGKSLGRWEPYDKRKFRKEKNIIYLLPPAAYHSMYPNFSYLKAFASGWEHLQDGDLKLFISDHADWNDLLELVEKVKPKTIYTLHGDGTHLANHFSDKNIEVHMLHNS